ncbi:MAG: pitrilysin family protein, partial [Kiritimatiellia bacterium]|nr:pitrilysin family protein [Kiritimatiellia bacterium]
HLIEHMIFKGTPTRKPADISKEINDAGGSINAYTTFDRTVFWVDMPAECWQTGLDILADAVLNASFPEDEWRREKDVIRREMAMGNDDPDRVLSKLLWQTAYLVHPYRFPVIGKEETFNTLARVDLLTFFRRHYTPDNMIIAMAGKVDAASVRAAVESRFSGLGRRARPLPAQTVEPPQLNSRIERKTGAYNISRLEMAWHTVGLSHPDAPALDILSIIAGGGKSSRLGQKIKENRKLAFSIDAWSYTPKDAGLFGISAAFDPAKEEELIKAIEAEVADWRTNSVNGDAKACPALAGVVAGGADPGPVRRGGPATVVSCRRPNLFTTAEIDKARNKITADTLLAFQTMHGKADTFASGEFYAGTPVYFNIYLKRLANVTPESLQTVAGRYLNDSNRTIAILSPVVTNESNSMHGNFLPAAEKFVAGVADPGPASTRPATEIKIVKKIFPNGLTLLCREDRRLPFVDFYIVSQGGILLENEKNSGITCLMAELLTRGTKTFSQEEIAETIESSGGSFSSFSGMNSYGLQARCFSKDAELFMDVLSDCCLGPVFSEEEIAKSKVIQTARIKQQRESPMFLAQEALRKALFAGHPYSLNVEGTRESVMAVTREELRRLHSETAVGSNTVLAVFGDISPVKAGEIAEKFLGKMAAGRRQDFLDVSFPTCPREAGTDRESRRPDHRKSFLDSLFRGNDRGMDSLFRGNDSEKKRRIELTAPREQTVVLAGFPGFAVTDERIDALDIVLNALNGLSSDLMVNVRDKKGLAYYTGAYHRAGIAGGQFVVYSGTRSEEAVHVQEMIIKEVRRIAGKGLRADEFERAKRQIIAEHRQNLQVNAGIAMECALNELYGCGYSRSLETEKRLAQLSPDDVRKAAAEIMRMEKMVIVTVKPEAN